MRQSVAAMSWSVGSRAAAGPKQRRRRLPSCGGHWQKEARPAGPPRRQFGRPVSRSADGLPQGVSPAAPRGRQEHPSGRFPGVAPLHQCACRAAVCAVLRQKRSAQPTRGCTTRPTARRRADAPACRVGAPAWKSAATSESPLAVSFLSLSFTPIHETTLFTHKCLHIKDLLRETALHDTSILFG